jgi:hypothetical protein
VSARFRLYRVHHVDGSSKDWAIRATEDGVVVRYGKTGRVSRLHEIPRASRTFRAATPQDEAERRIGEQLRQGYEYVGEVTFDARSLVRLESEAPRARHLHWSVVAPVATELEVWAAAVLSRAREIGAVLGAQGYFRSLEAGADTIVLQRHDRVGFCFGFCEEPTSGRISRRTRRGSGSANAARVVEVLFLLALARAFPEFALADDAGEVIEPRLEDNPLLANGAQHHARVAEALGLAPACIHWDTISAPTPALFY